MLWTLFFVLLALGRTAITTYTGWALELSSQVTTTVPALLGLTGHWPTGSIATTTALLLLVGVFGGAALLAHRTTTRTRPEHAPVTAAA